MKNRYSYSVNNVFTVDLTAVRTRKIETYKFSKSRTLEADETYEVEIEYVPSFVGLISETNDRNEFDMVLFIDLLSKILCNIRNVLTIKPFNDLYEVEKSYFKTLTKSSDYGLQDRKNFKIAPNVVTLTMRRLRLLIEKANDYYVTPKSDGVRMLGYIHNSGELFLLGSKSSHFEPTGYMFENDVSGTVFVGDFVKNDKSGIELTHYLVFDCYYDKNEDLDKKI